MNRDQAKGTWDQVDRRVKKAWGEPADFRKAEGFMDKLSGVSRQKVGETQEAITAKLENLHLK